MSNKNIILAMVLMLALATLTAFLTIGHGSGMEHQETMIKIDSEQSFLEHMIPHHEEAVFAASDLLAEEVRLRPVRDLANNIIESQNSEIVMMKEWYQSWYGEAYQDNESYHKMMRSLDGVSVLEREKIFLEDMIKHHEMAVIAANQVLELRISGEVRQLAEAILIKQTEEIRVMKELLKLMPTS